LEEAAKPESTKGSVRYRSLKYECDFLNAFEAGREDRHRTTDQPLQRLLARPRERPKLLAVQNVIAGVKMAEVWDLVAEFIQGSHHPDLEIYRKDLAGMNRLHSSPFDQNSWLRRKQYLCQVGRFHNARILEVGCGFGWDAVTLSLIGNNHVVASDILPSMIEGLTECLGTMRRKGKPLNVEPLVADICKTDLPSESFDGIFSSQAIEHVHSLEAMFDECHRLLKPGKRLVIANDSNRFNPECRESTFKMWKERDTSWQHTEWLKKEIRPVEHKDARPYAAMREDFVRRAAPELNEAVLAKLVAATAGMIGSEIGEATRAYMAGGILPTPPEFSWCRNPETGEYAERLLDPFKLVEMLNQRGFQARVGHAFTKFPHRLLNNIQFRPLNIKLYAMRPLFVLLAEKNPRSKTTA
jgi:SAM-dependent methyltransferase